MTAEFLNGEGILFNDSGFFLLIMGSSDIFSLAFTNSFCIRQSLLRRRSERLELDH
uniref:Uncharacterized protein n=1 Tax=Salix viminalis TaxID=40686 RepID=A0A6N2MVE2_SALVM